MSPEAPVNQPSSIEQLWQSVENKPLTAEALTPLLPQMRQELAQAGINLEPGQEVLQSLSKTQFRDWESGRGPAVKNIIGQKSDTFFAVCLELGSDCPKLTKGDENSRGRGLRQWVADTILLLTNPHPSEEEISAYVLKTNQRIKKYSEHNLESQLYLHQAYQSIPPIEDQDKWKQFTSLPPKAVGRLWQFLL